MRERSPTVVAIVPAAGASGRMGTMKQLLDVNGRPMLLGVVEALGGGGVRGVTIVSRPEFQSHLASRLPPGARIVVNDQPGTEMIDSIRIGLDASTEVETDGYLVCPCDAVGIAAEDVRRCLNAFAETPERIIIATHGGRRGHPIIFPASLAQAVRSAECDAGLNRLARDRPDQVREVPCAGPGTIANANTRADYERLR